MSELSVVVPAFNAGAFLRSAVDSLLCERLPGLEIVVVDARSGSTDGSVESLAGLPIKVMRQPGRGEANARNAGVAAATGAFVTFLDADDLMTPRALAARLEFLKARPAESAVGGLPSRLIDARGGVVAEVFARMAAKYTFPFRLSDAHYRSGAFFPVGCSLYLYRRELLARVGPYDENPALVPDCDFHFRVLKLAEIPILALPVLDRRFHDGNLSLAGAGTSAMKFRPEILAAVRETNRRHGFSPKEIVPWEAEYL